MPEINKINKSLGELEEELTKIKSASEMIDDAKETTKKTVNETKEIMSELIEKTEKATDSAIKESKKLNKAAEKLLNMVTTLMEKLDNVDFPTRLDKLDSTVSGINSGIQNILSRFDSIERNIKDEIQDKITASQKELENTIEIVENKLARAQKINLYLLLGILIIIISLFGAMFYNMGWLF